MHSPNEALSLAQLLQTSTPQAIEYIKKLYSDGQYESCNKLYEEYRMKLGLAVPTEIVSFLNKIRLATDFITRRYNTEYYKEWHSGYDTNEKLKEDELFIENSPILPSDEICLYYLRMNMNPMLRSGALDLPKNSLATTLVEQLKNRDVINYYLGNPHFSEAIKNNVPNIIKGIVNSPKMRNKFDSYQCFLLGVLFEFGNKALGVAQDRQKAKQYYHAAVSKDSLTQIHPEAACIIAREKLLDYEHEKSGKENKYDENKYQDAKRLLIAARELKHPEASLYLAEACHRKIGVLKNKMDALEKNAPEQNSNDVIKALETQCNELREEEIEHLESAATVPLRCIRAKAYESLYMIAIQEEDSEAAVEYLIMAKKYGSNVAQGYKESLAPAVNAMVAQGISSQWQNNASPTEAQPDKNEQKQKPQP